MTSPMRSSTTSRVNSLSPPATVTNGLHITRADYQRWAHEDRNHSSADTTRREKEERRRFREAEKQRWKSRGTALQEAAKLQATQTAAKVAKHKERNGQLGLSTRQQEDALRKQRQEQIRQWTDYGYELTQQYTIKAAQNNMRSLKAQNAGIVNGMQTRRQARETIVDAQRQSAQEERRQRVEKIRSETTDNVTRAAKKAYVDERWDIADAQREMSEAMRQQRKSEELRYLESALAITASPSMEPAKMARAKAAAERREAALALKEKARMLREQANREATSSHTSKHVVHDALHSAKFVPEDEAKRSLASDPSIFRSFFSFRSTSSRTKPYEITL